MSGIPSIKKKYMVADKDNSKTWFKFQIFLLLIYFLLSIQDDEPDSPVASGFESLLARVSYA